MRDQHIHKRRTRRSSPTIKTVAVILCIGCLFVLPVFAQTTETTGNGLAGFQKFLQEIVSVMSRGWMVLAILAGKLMTNDRVYGSIFHMDIYLWKIWNIMKNFANFALVAVVLGTVLKNLFGKGDIKIKDVIVKTLVAGVLIQASWFIVGALVDLSTVAVSAVGAFPATFLQTDAVLQSQITTTINSKMNGKSIKIDSQDLNGNTLTDNPAGVVSDEDALTAILPNASSIGGPLIFLGMSAFRFQEYLNLEGGSPDVKTLTVNFSLKILVLFFYTLGLLLIFIANLIRIVFLRLFIIASPFIIIIKLFQKDKIEGGEGAAGKKFAEYLNFSTLINLIFKPVLLIATMSFILIFIVALQNIMTGSKVTELNGVHMSVENKTATLAVDGISSIKVNDDIFSDIGNSSKSVFVDLIIFMLAIFMVWEMVKLSLTSGGGPVAAVMKPITEFIENFSKSIPIFKGFSYAGMKATRQEYTKEMLKPYGMVPSGEFREQEEAFRDKVGGRVGMHGDWKESDYQALKRIIRNKPGDFFGESIAKAKDKSSGLTLGNTTWKGLLEDRLKREQLAGTLKENFKYGNSQTTMTYKDFDQFFGKEGDTDPQTMKNRRILHNLMGGSGSDETSTDWTSETYAPSPKELASNIYFRPRGPAPKTP